VALRIRDRGVLGDFWSLGLSATRWKRGNVVFSASTAGSSGTLRRPMARGGGRGELGQARAPALRLYVTLPARRTRTCEWAEAQAETTLGRMLRFPLRVCGSTWTEGSMDPPLTR